MTLLRLILVAVVVACYVGRARAAWPHPEIFYTLEKGIRYGIVQRNGSTGRRPVLVALTGALSDTLGCNATGTPDPCYYANACEFLVPRDWICASLDLPSHGEEREPGEPEGIEGWRWRVDRGENIADTSNNRISALLKDLDRRGLADMERIAVSGISRGGFLAAHYAVFDARIVGLGMLAPVTNLTLLDEFDGYSGSLADSLSLIRPEYASRLIDRNIWAIIGDQDTRVYTDSLVQTMRSIQCFGCNPGPRGIRYGCSQCPARTSETVLQVAYEPEGHTVPPSSTGGRTSFRALAMWLERMSEAKRR
eukprot:g906.t1